MGKKLFSFPSPVRKKDIWKTHNEKIGCSSDFTLAISLWMIVHTKKPTSLPLPQHSLLLTITATVFMCQHKGENDELETALSDIHKIQKHVAPYYFGKN